MRSAPRDARGASSRNSASSRDSTPWRSMTRRVSRKMITVIAVAGLATELRSTYTSTRNETSIAT